VTLFAGPGRIFGMLLSPSDAKLFFKLHRTLMFFANQRLGVLPDEIATPDEFADLSPETRLKVRNAFLDDIDLTEFFVAQNPARLPDDELDIVHTWRHLVAGEFYIFRDLKKYTVFLSSEEQPTAYGVTALTQPFEELVGPYLPVLVETVLLPFKDKIVYDGLLAGPGMSLSFGPGIRRMLNESYQQAKAHYGIVTSLPVSDKFTEPKGRPHKKAKVDAADVSKIIVAMTDEFCRDHLNEEYAVLCRRMAETLARKRPSPLVSGKPNAWACGIVRTVGWVNFLSDPTQEPHMKTTAIDSAFGVGESNWPSEVELDAQDAKNSPTRSSLDAAGPHGREPAGLDAQCQWIDDGHSRCAPRGAGSCL
jgi:Domain of unknown function (DUF6398)